MAGVVLLARYWILVFSVVVFLAPYRSSSEIIWSEDRLNGCCGKCNTPNQCKATSDLKKTPIKCSYIQYDKTQINASTSITKSCGKPDKLNLKLEFGNDTVLNVTWKFPRDETIARVTGFLVVVQYENPSVSGEIVNWFKFNGTLELVDEELMKLTDVEFVYDCVKVLPNTTYIVTVQTLPSIKEAALERATLRTNDIDERVIVVNANEKSNNIKKSNSIPLSSDPQANCNSRWVSKMFVRRGNPTVEVCFQSAPELLKINKYILHVMPRSQYDGPDPRSPENMEKIDLTGRGLSDTTICRNFTLKEPKEYVAMLQPDEFCTCFNDDEVCRHTYIIFVVPSAPSTISLSALTFPPTPAVVGPSGTPTWHVALIAFFISLIVVTGVILLAMYCFISGFKDFLKSLLFHFYPTSDTTVLLVFQPTCDSPTSKAIWNFVCHLKWKSRAAIETVPDLDTRNGRCAGVGADCIKSKPDEPSTVCQCFCCKMDVGHTVDVVSKVKLEILRYNRIILFHSSESSKNYQVFQNTNDIPVRTCSAFVRVASLYDCRWKPAINEEQESVNQLIIGVDCEQMNPNPEPMEDVRCNPVGSAQLRSNRETPLELSGRKESGYYSCHEDEIVNQTQGMDAKVEYQEKDAEVEFQGKDAEVEFQEKDAEVEFQGKDAEVEFQGKKTEAEFQEDKLEQAKLVLDCESFERSNSNGTSARSSLDRSLCRYGQSLPKVLHVRLGSDQGIDMDLLKSSFKSPEVLDAVKDFSEIVNNITDTSIRIFVSPSVVSEI